MWSKFWLGKKLSKAHIEKIRKSHMGQKAWNKGLKLPPMSEEHKRIIGQKLRGRKLSKEHVEKIRIANTGKKHSLETRNRISLVQRGRIIPLQTRIKLAALHKGSKSHLWRGGKTEESQLIRCSLEYRLWREAVFKRDNWTCVWCKKRGGRLEADHIKPFCNYPELRFAIDNGRTLCKSCHKTTDTYGSRSRVAFWMGSS